MKKTFTDYLSKISLFTVVISVLLYIICIIFADTIPMWIVNMCFCTAGLATGAFATFIVAVIINHLRPAADDENEDCCDAVVTAEGNPTLVAVRDYEGLIDRSVATSEPDDLCKERKHYPGLDKLDA